jgi:hypothetical protein
LRKCPYLVHHRRKRCAEQQRKGEVQLRGNKDVTTQKRMKK